jgi:hypothetical protein
LELLTIGLEEGIIIISTQVDLTNESNKEFKMSRPTHKLNYKVCGNLTNEVRAFFGINAVGLNVNREVEVNGEMKTEMVLLKDLNNLHMNEVVEGKVFKVGRVKEQIGTFEINVNNFTNATITCEAIDGVESIKEKMAENKAKIAPKGFGKRGRPSKEAREALGQIVPSKVSKAKAPKVIKPKVPSQIEIANLLAGEGCTKKTIETIKAQIPEKYMEMYNRQAKQLSRKQKKLSVPQLMGME